MGGVQMVVRTNEVFDLMTNTDDAASASREEREPASAAVVSASNTAEHKTAYSPGRSSQQRGRADRAIGVVEDESHWMYGERCRR